MSKIFGLYPSCAVDEFFALLAPEKVSTFIFRSKGPLDKYSYKVDDSHVRKIIIPKLGRGKFGAAFLPNFIDYVFHALVSVISLPYLLTFDKIVFKGPPFLDTVIIPVLRLFRKKIYLISIDDQEQNIDHYADSKWKRLYYWFALKLERWAVLGSDRVYVTSNYMLHKYRHWGQENVVHVPNGADVDHIRGIKAKKLKKKGHLITYLGGFEQWRGLDILVDAFRIVQKHLDEKMVLLLIGGGPDFERMKEYCKDDKNIVLTGYKPHDEGIAYCKGSDILVMPSRNCLSSHTISSIKCFEYMACEVPVIVTDSGEHAHWINHYKAGLVVDDNAQALAKGIHQLLTEKNLYSSLKRSAKENADKVDYKVTKKAFRDILKD